MTVAHPPAISVYMSVHNTEPFLDQCVESILGQSETDLEFVIVDDASTDASSAMLRRWASRDSRIRLIASETRLGLVGGLSRAVEAARAPLCARMDADDISHRDRLARQRRVLEADPGVALVGTLASAIDSDGRPLKPRDRWPLLGGRRVPPFAHATAMFRRALFDEVGGYRAESWLWEDVDLCFRMAERGRILILTDALYAYRLYASSTTLEHIASETGHAFSRMLDAAGAAAGRAGEATGHRDAATLYYLAASRLWARLAPAGAPKLRDLRRLPLSVTTLKLLVLATWGRWSPGSLRAVLRAGIRLRDAAAGLWIADGAVEWRWR